MRGLYVILCASLFVQLYVTDSHRIRSITISGYDQSQLQGIWSFNRVATIAGSLETGVMDGIGQVARFNNLKVRLLRP